MKETNSKIQCAACGFLGKEKEFFNSSVHNKFKICPVCGTVKFLCGPNRNYRKKEPENEKEIQYHETMESRRRL